MKQFATDGTHRSDDQINKRANAHKDTNCLNSTSSTESLGIGSLGTLSSSHLWKLINIMIEALWLTKDDAATTSI